MLLKKLVSRFKAMKLIKKILLVFLLFITILFLANCKLISYGVKQGAGQIRMLRKATPIEQMMKDPLVPDSLKQKFLIVEQIKRYAFDSLGLNPSKNYNTFYDQKGQPILWVATACYPYKMETYLWKFPIVGKVPYKGYFKEEGAIKEANRL
jgi:predicted aminopeptidase